MGCASSKESVAGVATRTTRDYDSSETKKKNTHKTREKQMTKSTETSSMAVSSVSAHDEIVASDPANAANTDTDNAATDNETTTKTVVGNFTVQYACATRRGRDPDDASKPNQDSYSVHPAPFANEKSDIFLGVYDGHGPTGQECSELVQQRLPALIQTKLKEQPDLVLSVDQIQESLSKAHAACNTELHKSSINDAFSGTTAISLYLQGEYGRITVCNVGDSRAVLGTRAGGDAANSTSSGLTAVPLSNDQTPHRPDEANRCKRSGARILSFGQIDPSNNDDDDEDDEDPPRVWAPTGKYPGTAFTRSIGDAVAEELGVFAEPEMLTLKLSSNEKVIVLASDGIFDVLSNQQVIDMCWQYADPTEACNAIIDKSHEEWLKNEDCVDEELASYDDMTIACIFLGEDWDVERKNRIQKSSTDNVDAAGAAAANTENAQAPPSSQEPHAKKHRKRVRQKTLRNLEEIDYQYNSN